MTVVLLSTRERDGLPTRSAARWRVGGALFLVLGFGARDAVADDADWLGDARTALPGVHRVPAPLPVAHRVAAAATLGYGFTEAQPGESGAHHRGCGSLALSAAPLPWLQPALFVEGRHDRHPDDELGADSGTLVEGLLSVRAVAGLGRHWFAGAEASASLPAGDDFAASAGAVTPQIDALLGWAPGGSTLLAARAGYRPGRGDAATAHPERLRAGDRLALGASEFDAVPLGLAAAARSGPVELLAEGTWDVLLGAPRAGESPLRAAVGARYALTERIALQGMGEYCFSRRPELDPDAPLVPVEPRWSATLGLRFRFGDARRPVMPPAIAPKPSEPAQAAPPPPAVAVAALRVRVVDAGGAAVSDAAVELEISGRVQPLAARGPSEYAAEVELAPGTGGKTAAKLRVRAAGFLPREQPVELAPGKPLELGVQLEPAPLPAQLRGLVRSFTGKGLGATIRVEPLGVETSCDRDGFFELDVPPGVYEVTIRAEGYVEQKRSTKVEQGGVTVLNVDLRRSR